MKAEINTFANNGYNLLRRNFLNGNSAQLIIFVPIRKIAHALFRNKIITKTVVHNTRMTNHELTFSKIKELLKSHFPEKISKFEDGTHLTLDSENEEESSIWIELDQGGQLTVGFGISHLHYDPKYDDLNKGFNEFLLFLTCKKRRIDYYKGKIRFKNEYEFENKNGTWENYGTALTWAFPFWKKTVKKTTTQNGFINYTEIESEIEKIKSTMHNTV